MNTLTKLALGMIGQLKAKPVEACAASTLPLPPAQTTGGLPLMQARRRRQSQREFDPAPLPDELYRYNAGIHDLHMVRPTDVRRVTGYRDFVDRAPLDLVYVALHERLKLVPAAQRDCYAWLAAGAMSQNAYLYCAGVGLSTAIRAWIDRSGLGQAMALSADEQVLVAQTGGLPAAAGPV